MGLFGRPRDREETMRQAEGLTAGRGVTGKLARAFIGAENADRMRDGLAGARASHDAANAAAAGFPRVTATVVDVADTGQLINFDPLVRITATLANGSYIRVQSLVSRIQVPRPGEVISLYENAAEPGTYLYGGPAV